MIVRLDPTAGTEYDDALDHYLLRDDELATRFADDYDKLTRQILQFPQSGKRVAKSARQALFSRFPYKLIYRVEGDEIVIHAVAHQSRRPGYWRQRIGCELDAGDR